VETILLTTLLIENSLVHFQIYVHLS